ncbi:hypothetical protein RvY_09225 [Ramazzottius varieornatus]|uniref:KASH domain-containing protein n=1 Tax=Ramazzottius varieornatus TaxID=947166 RepID=A0A1D1V8J8_RAMVA|nr:hypothetical protein RvY_09225 [Ramazzottius varieornatus]
MSEEKQKIGMGIDCLLHRVRHLENYLHNLPMNNSVDSHKVRQADEPLSAKQALLNHLEVQSAIERLVNALAGLRRQCEKDSAVVVSQNKQANKAAGDDFFCLDQPAGELSMRKVVRLEKRLKHCWLRSLEYQFLLESFLEQVDPMTECNGDQWNELSDDYHALGAHLEPYQKRKRFSLDQKNVHTVATFNGQTVGTQSEISTKETSVGSTYCFQSATLRKTYPDILTSTPVSLMSKGIRKSQCSNRSPMMNRDRALTGSRGRRTASHALCQSTQRFHTEYSIRRRKVVSRAVASSSKKRTVLRNLDNDRATTGYDSQTTETSDCESLPEHRGFQPAGMPSFITGARGTIDTDAVFWDDYQAAPYSSDAYSEHSIDDNFISRVTDFGEDYSKILPTNSETLPALPLGVFSGETTLLQATEQEVDLDQIVTALQVPRPNQHSSSTMHGDAVRKTFSVHGKSEYCGTLVNNQTSWLSQATKTEQLIHDLILQWRDFHSDLEKRQTCDMLGRCADELLQSVEIALDSPIAIPRHLLEGERRSHGYWKARKDASSLLTLEYEEEAKVLDSLEEDVKYVVEQISVQHASECFYCTSTGKVAALVQRASSHLHTIGRIRQKVREALEACDTISLPDSSAFTEPVSGMIGKCVQTEIVPVDCTCNASSLSAKNKTVDCPRDELSTSSGNTSADKSTKSVSRKTHGSKSVGFGRSFIVCTMGLFLMYCATFLLTPTCCTFSTHNSFFQLSTHGHPPF